MKKRGGKERTGLSRLFGTFEDFLGKEDALCDIGVESDVEFRETGIRIVFPGYIYFFKKNK